MVNSTAVMNMAQEDTFPEPNGAVLPQTEKKNGHMDESTRSQKQAAAFRTIMMSPVGMVAPMKLNTVRESNGTLQGPLPMDSISDFRKLAHLRN